jgi:N-methylhydantoinase A
MIQSIESSYERGGNSGKPTKYQICIDIGGTFTDCVVLSKSGAIDLFKAASTPDRFERGFLDSLELAAAAYESDLKSFLTEVETIIHGSTVSTNALVEGKVARVGFITNDGFPDTLLLREAPRKRSFAWRIDYPAAFVPRERTATIKGRIDSKGNELLPLDEAAVTKACEQFKLLGVEAVAVCLLWSIVNPKHELRVRELVSSVWPSVPITLSHELNPIPREYRRAISSCMDASVHPIVSAYTKSLMNALDEAGFQGSFLLANCVGGVMPPEEIINKPIYSVMSGPALAPVAAQQLTSRDDVIVVDMGGTTFDVSAIRGGQLVISSEAMIGNDLLGIPKVDVRSIGAGGGSIAWVDVGGLLRVGPMSAGASPGPACYGRGGVEPTVTDANVILGIIDPDFFLGGRMKLDRSAAEAAVGVIANKMRISVLDAAYAIYTTSNHNMITAIEDVTIKEGIDPRESFLIAGGGATACHIGEMVNVLGMGEFLVPKLAAGLSAFGGLMSDVRWEESATFHTDHRKFDFEGVNSILKRLKERGGAFLDRAAIPNKQRRYEVVVHGHYRYQSWDIEVPVPSELITSNDLPVLVDAFHEMHERIYTIKDTSEVVEFNTWKVRAIGGKTANRQPVTRLGAAETPPVTKSYRPVLVRKEDGLVDLPIFDGNKLRPNHTVAGAAIIEENTCTILLQSNQTAKVDDVGNYLIRCE